MQASDRKRQQAKPTCTSTLMYMDGLHWWSGLPGKVVPPPVHGTAHFMAELYVLFSLLWVCLSNKLSKRTPKRGVQLLNLLQRSPLNEG
jgi:hypothetical protein